MNTENNRDVAQNELDDDDAIYEAAQRREGSFLDHPNVQETMREEPPSVGEPVMGQSDQFIWDRIEHILTLYPKISRSMLQVGIGTSIPPGLWTPIYSMMKLKNRVKESSETYMTSAGRMQTYMFIELVGPGVALNTGIPY